jgi:hypothetical protein
MNDTGARIGAAAEDVERAVQSLDFGESTAAVAAETGSKASVTGKLLSAGAKAAKVVGKILAVEGALVGGAQVGGGINKIAGGDVLGGAIDIAEGASDLGLSIATEAGLAAGGLATAAGLAAAGGIGLAAETARAASNGQLTPIDVADRFYGTHSGDIAGWMSGAYSKH